MSDRMMPDSRIDLVPCPLCHVAAGQTCRGFADRPGLAGGVHYERTDLAHEVWLAERDDKILAVLKSADARPTADYDETRASVLAIVKEYGF